jgi:predicted dehydrogenase
VNIAIVGCGLVGRKRAAALGPHRLVACADIDTKRAEALARDHPGCVPTREVDHAINHPDVDAVIVATTNDALVPTTLAAITAGRHVLVEKPAARTAAELRPVLRAAVERPVVVKVGFNHRFHPAFRLARRLFDSGAVGRLMYIRARYGHGGRPGYEREWRADPRRSGGGELLDQGVHLIDLARWFAGEFTKVSGHVGNYFWPMSVEDNGFLMLQTATGQIAWLHASCTEWKNLFSFEIFGRQGKLQVDGLGGSYGTERLTYYRMLPEMGPPETTCWEFPGTDDSWQAEIEHFAHCIATGAPPSGGLEDALAALEIVDRVYQEAGRDYHA